MDEMTQISLSMPKTLFDQAERLAHQLHLSPTALFVHAIEQFIANPPNGPMLPTSDPVKQAQNAPRAGGLRRVIQQGDVCWVTLENASDMESAIPHPYVVVQDNVFNHSRIQTIVACALTSNLRRMSDTPGNVLLEIDEANLPKQSVVEVSKVTTLAKTALGEYIGSLTQPRIDQILAGMRFLQMSYPDN